MSTVTVLAEAGVQSLPPAISSFAFIDPNDQVETWLGRLDRDELADWEYVMLYMSPLRDLFDDPEITEILVHRYDFVRVERAGRIERTNVRFKSEAALQTLIVQLGRALDQPVGKDYPILDARLPDASRMCCVLNSVSMSGSSIAIRRTPKRFYTFEELVGFGALNDAMVDYLREHMEAASNMLVAGNTGSGKTTILRACNVLISSDEVKMTAEDTQELYLPDAEALVAPRRKPKDGAMQITLQALVEAFLRKRPDRPWIGEIRTAAVASAFLQLANTGHSGLASSLHSNSNPDSIRRIQYLIASEGLLGYELAGHQITSCLQLLVHCKRDYQFGRRIDEIAVIRDGVIVPIFRFDRATRTHIRCD